MGKLFGTDGIRGVAGEYPLDERTLIAVGRSLVKMLSEQTGRHPRLIVGRDTRESGPEIEAVLARGVASAGGQIVTAGVITTPGVAYLTRALGFDAGVVISASHNQYRDNGIKIFSSAGTKLDDATEAAMEREIQDCGLQIADCRLKEEHDHASRITDHAEEGRAGAYLRFLSEEVGRGLDLSGFRVALDCAHGAAYRIAPEVFRRLGAEVRAIGVEPNGRNINLDGGSLHPEKLQTLVVEAGCDLGVTFDGDADRALFVSRRGRLFDGDDTLYVLACYLQDRDRLNGGIVVGTEMTNLGLEQALTRRALTLHRTKVGDRFVLEKLVELKASLGGEQSGHIIISDISLAGDGLITALEVFRVIKETGRELSDLTEEFTRFPQVLINVAVREKPPFDSVPEITQAVHTVEARLGGRGRLVLRYSGTEPLARVMVEADDQALVNESAEAVAEVIRRHLGN
jgi:phosphoglucosamine mutase